LNATIDSMLVYFNNGISNSEDHQLPTTNYQLTNYPNPFNPETTIQFTAEDMESAEVIIYNIKGQKIRQYSIFNNQSSIIWNGTDNNKQPVSNGIYFYELRVDGKNVAIKKMILLK
jgi:hypothetical protein